MVVVAQLVRASVCGTEGRRFESGLPPKTKKPFKYLKGFFCTLILVYFLTACALSTVILSALFANSHAV